MLSCFSSCIYSSLVGSFRLTIQTRQLPRELTRTVHQASAPATTPAHCQQQPTFPLDAYSVLLSSSLFPAFPLPSSSSRLSLHEPVPDTVSQSPHCYSQRRTIQSFSHGLSLFCRSPSSPCSQSRFLPATMASADVYDYYTFDHDKYIFSSHGGKQRSKREVAGHTNRFDPNGHSRKISTKIRNTEKNALTKQPVQRSNSNRAQAVAAF